MESKEQLQQAINKAIAAYFHDSSWRKMPVGIYDDVLHMMERPLIESVLKAAKGNQVRSAEILGVNRNTLRRMCATHGINATQYYIDGINHRGYTGLIKTISA